MNLKTSGAMPFYYHHPKQMLLGKQKKKEEQPVKTFAEVLADKRNEKHQRENI